MLFQRWDIDPEREHVFVKIDVESYECFLLPSWKAWFAGLNRKPTLYLSLHENVSPCTDSQYQEIAQLAKRYKYLSPGLLNDDGSILMGKKGEYILSDYFPPMEE